MQRSQTAKNGAKSAPFCALLGVLAMGAGQAEAAAGDHIRPSSGTEVTPSVSLGSFYRTNVYLQEGIIGGGAPEIAGIAITVNPTLEMSVKGPDADLEVGLGYTARKFVQADLANLDRYSDVELDGQLGLMPDGVVGIRLTESFRVTGNETEAATARDAYMQHTINRTDGRLLIRPGSSLELGVGGNFGFDNYRGVQDNSGAAAPSINSRVAYGPSADLQWRFFPKTAVLVDFDMTSFIWGDNYVDARGEGISSGVVGDYLGVPDGKMWKAHAGVRGRFTDKLVLGVLGGYGGATYDEASVAEDAGNQGGSEATGTEGYAADLKGFPAAVIGSVELEYAATPRHGLTLGYARDFQDVYFTNYVIFHNLSAAYKGKLGDKLGIDLGVLGRLESYVGEVQRSDVFIRVMGDTHLAASDFMSVHMGAWWTQRASVDGQADIEYDDVRVHASIEMSY